jgi:hypothetical protein
VLETNESRLAIGEKWARNERRRSVVGRPADGRDFRCAAADRRPTDRIRGDETCGEQGEVTDTVRHAHLLHVRFGGPAHTPAQPFSGSSQR